MPFAAPGELGARIIVTPLDETRWKLLSAVRYTGATEEFIVPGGYVTDWATIPRVVVWLFPRFGNHAKAAILHDYLLTDCLPSGRITSRDADGLFRRAMRELGVPPVKRWLMWTGVRWGALFNARRRAGWWRSAPLVVAISIPAGLVIGPAALLVSGALLIYGVAEFAVTGGRRQGTLTT